MSARTPAPDQEIRDAIVQEIDTSCFVEASAGTGKTSLLVARILSLLARPGVRAEGLVAITFTEKAAAELMGRVRDALQRAVADPATPGHDALARALAELERAAITTIHSFCTRLLREFPVEAGISPGFVVIDELAAGRLFDATWEEWLAEELSGLDSPLAGPLECGARLEGGGPAALQGLKEMARTLARNRDLVPIGLEGEPPAAARARLVAAQAAALAQSLAETEALVPRCRKPAEDKALAKLAPALPAIRRALAAALAEPASAQRRLLALAPWPKLGTSGRAGDWADRGLEALREVAKAQVARDEAFGKAVRGEAAREAALALAGFGAAYARAKERQGALDFDDLLLKVRDLLRGNEPVRRALAATISHLLVDEYQDTDPLQAEIIFLLAADDPGESDWRRTRPAPGRLFLVGDPKQSIYRFRRADIAVYRQSLDLLAAAGGRQRRIEANFRTQAPIIDWVNGVFDRLMPPAPPDEPAGAAFRPAYAPLLACRAGDPAARPGAPAVVTLPVVPAESGAPARRREEARRLAEFVRQGVEAGGLRVQSRGGDGAWRAPAYGDIALLFRKFTAIGLFEDAFRDAGVPYRVDGGRLYFARSEVQGLAAVLRALDNPNDRLALVAALRSPFFGFDDETLLLAADAGRLSWAAEPGPRDPALAEAFGWFRGWHARRHARGPARLVEEVLEATRALELYSLKPDGEQRVANLQKIVDEARRFRADAGAFRAFLRHLAEREAATAAEGEGESPIQEESDNQFVRFLSVHKSKGLEFPIVILADAAGEAGGRTPNALVDRVAGRIALSLSFSGGTGYAPGWEELKAAEAEQAEAESIRLLYVAATRARDLLVIPAPAAGDKGSFLAMIPPEYRPEPLELPPGPAPAAARPLRFDPGEDAAPAPDRPDALGAAGARFEAARAALCATLPRAPLRLLPAALAAHDDEAGAGPGGAGAATGGAVAARPAGAGRSLGALVHAALERVDAGGAALEARVDRLRAEAGEEAPPREEVLRLARTALAAPVVRAAFAAAECRREAPFLSRHELPGGEVVYLDGKIDLAFRDDAGWTIVDYKTDRLPAEGVEALAQRYRGQALAYALGLGTALGLSEESGAPVREVVFLFLENGEERRIPIDAAALAEAEERLVEAARRARRDPGEWAAAEGAAASDEGLSAGLGDDDEDAAAADSRA